MKRKVKNQSIFGVSTRFQWVLSWFCPWRSPNTLGFTSVRKRPSIVFEDFRESSLFLNRSEALLIPTQSPQYPTNPPPLHAPRPRRSPRSRSGPRALAARAGFIWALRGTTPARLRPMRGSSRSSCWRWGVKRGLFRWRILAWRYYSLLTLMLKRGVRSFSAASRAHWETPVGGEQKKNPNGMNIYNNNTQKKTKNNNTTIIVSKGRGQNKIQFKKKDKMGRGAPKGLLSGPPKLTRTWRLSRRWAFLGSFISMDWTSEMMGKWLWGNEGVSDHMLLGLPCGPQKNWISRYTFDKFRYFTGLFRTVGKFFMLFIRLVLTMRKRVVHVGIWSYIEMINKTWLF